MTESPKESTTYNTRGTSMVRIFFVIVFLTPVFVEAGSIASFFGLVAEAQYVSEYPLDNAQTTLLLRAVTHSDPSAAIGGGDIMVDEDGVLIPSHAPLDEGGRTENNGEISTYVVREADSLSQIADMFGVSVNTILWANDIKNSNTIRPGDTLVILPVSGVRHVVKKGDTLKTIAQKYKGDVEDIIAYNRLEDVSDLAPGDTIVIPGGEVVAPTPKKKVASGGSGSSVGFKHPLPGSVRTQGIHGYNGVDLAAPVGTPVRAAAGGEVILSRSSGYNGGYGNYVVIKHGNGTQTLYAHLSRTAVAVGATVGQGETIGYVGNTGRSTGAHLHFEVRGAKNPF